MAKTSSAHRFIQILDKVPMFSDLNALQATEILKLCRPKSFATHEILCKHGSKSEQMYILLSGKLTITTLDGTPLTHLSPITIVGEMGIITGQPRSANVIAAEPSSVFEISKIRFDVLMKQAPHIGFRIFRNIINILSERLENNNKQLASSQRELAAMREKMATLPTA